MSNNLASQQLSIQSIQVGQLEHISNSAMQMGSGIDDHALQHMSNSNMQLNMMGPGSTDASSQQIPMSNNQARPLEPMSSNHASQKLAITSMQMRRMEPNALNMMSEQFILPNRQPGDVKTRPNNVGSSQQSYESNKRKAPMEQPTFNNSLSPKLSAHNKRMAQMEHRPWLQTMSSPNKLPIQMQSVPHTSGSQRSQAPAKRSGPTKTGYAASRTGPQQLSVQRSQPGQMQPSPKVRNDSFESVRSKLRESLAAALELVSKKQDKASSAGDEHSQPTELARSAADAVDNVTEKHNESLLSKDNSSPPKWGDGQNTSQETSIDGNAGDSAQTLKNDGLEFRSNIIFRDEDVSFINNFFVKDELLQGNGLSWVLEPDSEAAEKDIEVARKQQDQKDVSVDSRGQAVQTHQILASKIEEQLFKLFGGVNKKYKEKGRSLIFNLKDRNNPELRERVMSGEIPPERLCSMTAEELASEELSQWRMAKAEELAQMVVLPDSDVDIRRLVKKTHKGEFQVEVEQQDIVSTEVAVKASSLTQMRPKSKKEASPTPKPDQTEDKANSTGAKSNSEGPDVPCTFTIPSNEGNDLMQGLMVDEEFKDAEFLPPIVSLDEFMESLNSEPPFENLPVDAGKKTSISNENDSQGGSESKSPDATAEDPADTTDNKPDSVTLTNIADGKCIDSSGKSVVSTLGGVSKGELVWEGSLQLSISAMVSVIGIFKSGEKASAKEWQWPSFIEIKGRVRLDAFEKFLQELPMSRSRAVMAVQFICKEGSESEHASLREVADSYVFDGRVGFAEPASGAELYLCPPHSKTHEMLSKVLPKDQLNTLNSIDNGLIGVIVWRKAQTRSTVSPNSTSHYKHNSKKQHIASRRHQEKDTNNMNVNITTKNPLPRSNPQPTDEDDGDVPPGFGPPLNRDEDDLPEFNFTTQRPQFSNQNPIRGRGVASFHPHSQAQSRPVDQMRELVLKYGKPDTDASSGNWRDKRNVGVVMQPWNDDDDDMPEWNPDDAQHHHPPQQPVHMRGLQQRAHMVQPTTHQQIGPQGTSAAMPLQPQGNVMQPSWQQGAWRVSQPQGLPAYQPDGVQLYGAPGPGAGQQGTVWHRDASKSRGF